VQSASGHCTFPQRQGYVHIELRSGDAYELTPDNRANHFKDQKGHKVVRTLAGDNSQQYKWDHKKIFVTFSDKNSGKPQQQNHHSSGQYGDTPANLRDLLGQRGGQAEHQLLQRGYKLKGNSKSGDSSYSNWKEHSTGRCVTVRTVNGQYESIVYAPEYVCQH
jgi:hypothetical protein